MGPGVAVRGVVGTRCHRSCNWCRFQRWFPVRVRRIGRCRRLREFLTSYIEQRTKAGAFRELDPVLAARAFVGMLIDHLTVREVYGMRAEYPQTNAEVAETFVAIFLRGVRREERPSATSKRRRAPRRFHNG